MPRARSINAVVRPPIPPPTMIAFISPTPLSYNTTLFGVLHLSPQKRGEGADCALTFSLPPTLFRRKRLRGLGAQLGAGLRLSLNFQVVEILPVADAVAEDLLLAGHVLRRAIGVF